MEVVRIVSAMNLEAYGDFMLIVNLVCWENEVWHEDLITNYKVVSKIAREFMNFYI